jgi:methyl-accepting chemotaxis protein
MNANAVSGSSNPADRSGLLPAPGQGNPLSEFFRYHGLWAPGVRLFRSIGFRAKAMVISAMFMVPILLLAANYFRAQQANIDFSAKERLGVAYARASLPLLQHLLQTAPDAERTRSLLAELEKAQATLGADLGTQKAYADFRAALADTNSRPVQPLLDLLGVATDGSNLTLDPDIDTYYLMDAALFRLPVMADALARTRDAGAGKTRVVIEQATLLSSNLGAMQAGIAKAIAYNAEVGPAVRMDDAAAPATAFLKTLESTVLGSEGAAQALPAGAAQLPLDEQFKLADRALTALDGLIAARVGRMTADRDITLVVVVISLLGVAYLFISFRKVLDGGLKEVAFHIDAMRDGDLTTRPRAWGADEAARLIITLSEMQAALRRIVSQVRSASDSIVHASGEISSASLDLSGRTEQSAANLEETAAAMEQISATVSNNEATVSEATRLADANAQTAQRGGQIIGEVVQTMQAINGSSSRIGDIIGTIDGIAFQTNILALNAAVEAARAGEQGRGFAVVASEVRALAGRSAAAAREIKTLITTSMEQVENGTRVVRQAGSTIDEIVSSASRVRELLAEVANGAREQTAGIAQSAKAVQQLDTVTQQNAALVEQTAAAAGSLNDQAVSLSGEVAQFKLPA